MNEREEPREEPLEEGLDTILTSALTAQLIFQIPRSFITMRNIVATHIKQCLHERQFAAIRSPIASVCIAFTDMAN